MTTLITGSAGHLGEALMRTLRATSQDARGIDIAPSPFTDRTGSIAERAFVRDAMKGVRAVVHAATLHKPHVATHSLQDFVDTNITGTLVLLEEAAAAGVEAFVFTSTTSTFGAALTPAEGMPAAWITEDVTPIPKNIYGVTKTSAESLCELFHRRQRLPVVVLKTSRFFPEDDDDAVARSLHALENMQANELLHRRVDIEDVVDAHLLAVRRARAIGFGRYIVSATTPFTRDDLPMLRESAPRVLHRLFPDCEALYARQGWTLPAQLDRVYVNALARRDLGWRPRHDFAHVLQCLREGRDFRSQLARDVGIKGYHARAFAQGPYPVA
ncbi:MULTISPECIES: NAD(P)-dependent oxidoreductase [unclassified Variovorax]|uniref:NAD-dependent epimerase/dehydratase family protein n=1 Tax=unclassified Variovorax TaxID=663243 RepID=UPI0008B664F5|nr:MULTISPECIES: NAD(P)-dependent oxidoreductase [unclassified Variovorax]SEK13454.1 UDP-glucose 4-epimerase [Variovorax sp. OK202]SFD85182.1 UDP-glucose 4-epimerase [Variovorax sp. OK212]